jgi:hypothetical protein
MSALHLEEKIKAAADKGKKTVEQWWAEVHAWFDAEEAKAVPQEQAPAATAAPQTATGTATA